MRYSIRKVWNSPKERAVMDAMLVNGATVRRRGRGFRFGRREYHQSLPQSKAAYLTYYIDDHGPNTGAWCYDHYYEFTGLDKRTGKPRIRAIGNHS